MITPIEGIRPLQDIQKNSGAAKTQQEGASFGQIFQSAIGAVRETNATLSETQYLLATGQLDNPSSMMIAAMKYQISVDMLVQLRNRALDAYSELSRMSI